MAGRIESDVTWNPTTGDGTLRERSRRRVEQREAGLGRGLRGPPGLARERPSVAG
jgi:hypothetical protein